MFIGYTKAQVQASTGENSAEFKITAAHHCIGALLRIFKCSWYCAPIPSFIPINFSIDYPFWRLRWSHNSSHSTPSWNETILPPQLSDTHFKYVKWCTLSDPINSHTPLNHRPHSTTIQTPDTHHWIPPPHTRVISSIVSCIPYHELPTRNSTSFV